MRLISMVIGVGIGIMVQATPGATVTKDHARVEYGGIDAGQAEAIARTLAAARTVYADVFKFDMPETVHARVTCGPDQPTRLYTDGRDHVYLSIPSKDRLARPARSGVFNLYGLCHELGHMAMYRVLEDRDWMTSAAAEGWAHYAGSVVVDRLYDEGGESLWWDAYDYREDGTARLKRQLAARRPGKTSLGAGQWQRLMPMVGPRGFAKLFTAWQKAKIDPTEPNEALRAELLKLAPDREKELGSWWEASAELFVQPVKSSRFRAVRIPAKGLTGQPIELAYDDDASEGKKSIAGGGHAVTFSPPGPGEWYIRAVSAYGARYGHPQPPRTQFDIALCDKDMRQITVWKKPYGSFERGALEWVRMEVPPTQVPAEFYVCLNFRPTGTRGVFVAYDDSTRGHSLVGTPGKAGQALGTSDWMIRVELDQPKTADALTAEPAEAAR